MPINKATIMTRGTTLGHVSISRILCWFSVVEEFANNAICCNYVNAYCNMLKYSVMSNLLENSLVVFYV